MEYLYYWRWWCCFHDTTDNFSCAKYKYLCYWWNWQYTRINSRRNYSNCNVYCNDIVTFCSNYLCRYYSVHFFQRNSFVKKEKKCSRKLITIPSRSDGEKGPLKITVLI